MRRWALAAGMLALAALVAVLFAVKPLDARSAAVADPCVAPSQAAPTPEETAWRLFIAAACPRSGGTATVAWETWIEQSALFAPAPLPKAALPGGAPGGPAASGPAALRSAPAPHRFHVSPLARFVRESEELQASSGGARPNAPQAGAPKAGAPLREGAAPSQDCNSDTWSGRTICEETRIDPDAEAYIRNNGLTTLDGQQHFLASQEKFEFTKPSTEIKADWILLASCKNAPANVHVEHVAGSCYALGGMHVLSKLIDKWVWATFEPQNTTTNPQRCIALGCTDRWGASPAHSNGKATALSPALAALMKQAHLAPEWRNYRLDGVQVDFLDAAGKPTRLANSIIEGDNAGNPTLMASSSCISCHARSTISASGAQPPVSPSFVTGTPPPLAPGVAERDFVWSFLEAR